MLADQVSLLELIFDPANRMALCNASALMRADFIGRKIAADHVRVGIAERFLEASSTV